MSNIYEAPKADLKKEYSSETESQITGGMADGLEIGAKWAKILAIIGYIATGFIALGAVFSLFGVAAAGVWVLLLSLGYAIGAFVTYKISRFAHQYSTSINYVLESYEVYDLIEAQTSFRQYTKWTAVIMLIAVAFSFIAVLGAGAYLAAYA